MKRYILLFCLLPAFWGYAQDYKHFIIKDQSDIYIYLSLKSQPQPLSKTKQSSSTSYGLYSNKYSVEEGDELGKKFFAFYKEIFKDRSQEEINILKHIQYTIFFDEKFQPFRYDLQIPVEANDCFSELESLFYQFGQKCLQVDMKPYIHPLLPEEFKGSSFSIPLFWIMRFDK